jgi:hypothetical protein
MSGSGRGGDSRGNHRKPFKRRDRENQSQNRDSPKSGKKSADYSFESDGKFEKKRTGFVERPKWVPPPKQPAPSLPAISCVWCGKPIDDMSTAVTEPASGKPVHFDCAINHIIEEEVLERGDTVSYIGGGRFGVIHFNNPPDTRDFRIKKILEWENRENRSEWRTAISDYFTVT